MKKALSVLLIAAAIFGFYGGAINLNDVLASKDYWEEVGEKSTADMNKLEDGLNQLKDNEQAYLDGLVALEDGKAQLAEGEAALAEGEAAYAAAPGQLAAGEAAYSDLKRLISGLNTAKKHGVSATAKHDKYWHDAYSKALVPGQAQIIAGLNQAQAGGVLPLLETLTGASDLASKAANARTIEKFEVVVDKQLIPTFNNAATALNSFAALASSKATTLDNAEAAYDGLVQLEGNWAAVSGAIKMISQGAIDLGDTPTAKTEETAVDFIASNKDALAANDATKSLVAFAGLKDAFSGMSESSYYAYAKASALLLGGVGGQMKEFLSSKQGQMLQGIAAKGNPANASAENASLADKVAGIVYGMNQLSGLTGSGATDGTVFKGYAPAVSGGLKQAATLLTAYAKSAKENADLFQTWEDGYQTLYHGKDGKVSKDYPDDLASKSSGIPFAFMNMVNNSTIKAAVKQYDPSLMNILKRYKGDRLKNDSMAEFDEDITYLSKKIIPRALSVLSKVKASAEQQLAEGYAAYEAGPANLAAGRQQLADGYAALAAGEEKIAQYEDGEQQVRDGLATLMATEPDGGLESILDRRNGDADFDNGDTHLDLDEGLEAVDVGRGYQADSGELITKEITARAVGTAAGLGAGVLAVLAAILGLLKKNKGAGILAILSAAAGAVGCAYGASAGYEFSEMAGATGGNTAWIAFGVLAAVAAVDAIAHFAAKKEA